MLRPWLRIVRLPLAATAVCDVLACTLLAWMSAGRVMATDLLAWSTARDLGLLALTALLVYAAGMAGNDLADRHVDAAKAPDRPLPRGTLRARTVAIFVGLCVAGALALGGGPAGSRGVVGVALLLALAYDGGLKRRVVPGAATMGGVRAANASYAVLPLVLTGAASWWVLLAPLAIGLYSGGVTILSTTEEDGVAAHPERLWAARVLAAGAFVLAAGVAWLIGGQPTLGIGVAFGITTSTLFGRTPKAGPEKRMVLEMLLGLYWLAAVLAGGWHDGTLGGAVIVSFAALVTAWALAVGSQLFIRALRAAA